MKTIYKPWGKEEWLELNDRYCYKRIYINAGHRTSLQYHLIKSETIYMISGTAEVILDDEIKIFSPGDCLTITPGMVHRVIAKTDIIYHEVSTPEVDDVIRLEDDTNRVSGKLDYETQKPALCILTAGLGSRIEKYSKWINKGLLPIEDKAVISHIIEKTPKEYDIVVAVGHLASQIKDYLLAAHHDRDFIFVDVDKYVGEGSGPGYSLRACMKWLQRPFICAVSDCYFSESDMPALDGNWIGIAPTSLPELYSTVSFDTNNEVSQFINKTSDGGFNYAYIGIAGIYDYKSYWRLLEDSSENITPFIKNEFNSPLYVKMFNWSDIGTIDGYREVNKSTLSLNKNINSFSYHVGNRFIKIFGNSQESQDRVNRAKNIPNTPPIVYSGENLFAYDWILGDTIYQCDTSIQIRFIKWLQDNLWSKPFIEKDSSFVELKTKQRIENLDIPKDILDRIPWKEIGKDCHMTTAFHGDLHFENAVFDGNQFHLIDWRDRFDGEYGDIFYDLGKFYGGLHVNYSLAKYNLFEPVAHEVIDFFEELNSDCLDRIKWNTVLIWLSMIPLHNQEFSEILYQKAVELMKGLNR